ncbi:DNA photolyase [Candidatus Puniceispirillum sp.]|nr:DNA photolyase [Candidatus Puniceispirillum sp.]
MIGENKTDIFSIANRDLEVFLSQNLNQYSRLRNFDFGPDRRYNTSGLSKYISHRVFNEYHVVRATLKITSYEKAEKFIQEVFWRIYWKGWLEHRPTVWDEFIKFDKSYKKDEKYLTAIGGKTGIECFDFWVSELRETNYLHNHTRMWFASIWIFTLGLPWQAGALFFLEHLFDGDAASNTLGWRWVAGIHTKGKCYFARSENIHEFTNGKFGKDKFNESALPLLDDSIHQVRPIDYELVSKKKFDILLVMDSNLDVLNRNEIKQYRKVYIIDLGVECRQTNVSHSVYQFKQNLLKAAVQKNSHCEILESSQAEKKLRPLSGCDVYYPFIGENADFLNRLSHTIDIQMHFLWQHEDLFCWQFATKGYFNFKKNIPDIIKTLALSQNSLKGLHKNTDNPSKH